MGKFRKASDEVVKIAEYMINQYHESLKDARVGLLFRDEAPVTDGRVTLGQAKKINEDMKPYVQYDFVIWVAEDYWYQLTEKQKQALIDHELCHCYFAGRRATMQPHDINEFACILERHGVWYPEFLSPKRYERAFQAALFKDVVGTVEAVDSSRIRDMGYIINLDSAFSTPDKAA